MKDKMQDSLLDQRGLKIKKLKLKNFKGIRDFTLEPDGEDIDIFGQNATGKTTIYDSFLWLLFGKDSHNKTDFEIKTLTESGEPHHGLDHVVECVFEINGKKLTLKKVFSENWQKKRGSAEKTFSGHSTNHWVDGVPAQKKDYDARISEIANEDTFKLLTNPRYFNEQLHWQDRRRILLEVCGDISDEAVIKSNKDLAKLLEILKDRKLEDHRKVIAARRTEINKELEKIPVRIDECNQGLPDVGGISGEKTETMIFRLEEAIKEKESEILRIEEGGEIAKKNKELREIDAALMAIEADWNFEINQQIDQKAEERSQILSEVLDLERTIKEISLSNEGHAKKVLGKEEEMDRLRASWNKLNEEEFSYEADDKCPTCGQCLPEDQIKVACKKAREDFNIDKSEGLTGLSESGKELRIEVARLNSVIVANNKEAEGKKERLAPLVVKAEELEAEAETQKLKEQKTEPEESPRYQAKLEEKQEREGEILFIRDKSEEALAKIKNEISELQQQINPLDETMSDLAQYARGQARIEELKAEEKKLAKEFEKLGSEIYLTEEFIRTKVSMLENRINDRFEIVRFKLFDIQVNGAIAECCQATVNGVPYNDVNGAGKIQAGCDIIKTLSNYYQFHPVIWIDNRESVIVLPDMDCQIISLFVSAKDKKLRIETPKIKIKEAVNV